MIGSCLGQNTKFRYAKGKLTVSPSSRVQEKGNPSRVQEMHAYLAFKILTYVYI